MDIEEPWLELSGCAYDLIHLRTLNGSISDWPFVYDQIYRQVSKESSTAGITLLTILQTPEAPLWICRAGGNRLGPTQ